MDKLKFFSYTLAGIISLTNCLLATDKLVIVPNNFLQSFPRNIGTPSVFISIKDKNMMIIPFFKENMHGPRTVDLGKNSTIKDVLVEFGTQKLQFTKCTEEGESKKEKIARLNVDYDEKGSFSCALIY